MQKTKGMILFGLFFTVFFSGCGNKEGGSDDGNRAVVASYKFEQAKTVWLRDHLPNETLAYFNIPTPWNYLFDAKADAMHAVQALPAHIEQVAAIKQGVKDHYYQYIPAQFQNISSLLLEHMTTSLEVAVINYSPTAMLPTVAVGTSLKGLSSDELSAQLTTLLQSVDPSIELVKGDNKDQWTFNVNQFPAFIQYDQASGKLLMYGGMGANSEKMTNLWQESKADQLTAIKQLSHDSDPSGLNLKMWLAPARMYQLGGAFVAPEQHAMISKLGLDQMDYVWLGAESAQGQSALALHVMMPETGWRLMLPRASDWFDVSVAGTPRSVIQLALPTADQIKQAIAHFKLDDMLSEKDREELQVLAEFEQKFGFELYDFLKAYHQQVYMVTDDSGSWWAMKIKDEALHDKINKSMYKYLEINPTSKSLAGTEIMQAHFSAFGKFMESLGDQSTHTAKFDEFVKIFKDHAYWYVEDGVYYMSSVPQILADKRNTANPTKLSSWLNSNQGGNWDSAIFGYGKDVKDMPKSLYHFYLLMLQGLGDLAQVEVDLFALPTAQQLNLPDSGRINLVLSSDAEKVSFKFGYEYSFAESILTAEGGLATIAVAGILAAYAIPAYQDYTVRAKIVEQLSMASAIKMTLAEQYITTGSYAGAQELLDPDFMSYYIDEETGMVVIDLDGVDSALQFGDEIYLEPYFEEEGGYIIWSCYSNIKQSYLPVDCQD